MKAKTCHFYGWSPKQVEGLSWKDFLEYWHSITAIEAQQDLRQLQISDFPHLKKDGREKIFRKLKRDAYSKIDDGTKPKTAQEIALELARMFSGGRQG